jgi:predicted O-methyltransferase YrrM
MDLCQGEEIREYESFLRPEYWAHGSEQQRERIELVARNCVERYPGDLVEIGAYLGGTTTLLAMLAEEYDRRVIVVDPWETGTQNCEGYEFEVFLKNLAPWMDIIDIYRTRSDHHETISAISQRELSFAFVDGLHTGPAVGRDIQTVSHCNGIIAVDDILYEAKLRSAFIAKAVSLERAPVHSILWREGYLV